MPNPRPKRKSKNLLNLFAAVPLGDIAPVRSKHVNPRQTWKFQDAKAKLSELVDTALRDGPQMITRRGKDTVVVLPATDYARLTERPKKSLIDTFLDGPKVPDFTIARDRKDAVGKGTRSVFDR